MKIPINLPLKVYSPLIERCKALIHIHIFRAVQTFGAKQIHPRNVAVFKFIW